MPTYCVDRSPVHVSAPHGGHHEAAYFADLAIRFHGARRLSTLVPLIVEAAAGGQLVETVGAVVHAPITPGSGRPGGVLSLYPSEPIELRRVQHFTTYAGIALEGTWYRERLERSMDTHTTVGSGMGMLMER